MPASMEIIFKKTPRCAAWMRETKDMRCMSATALLDEKPVVHSDSWKFWKEHIVPLASSHLFNVTVLLSTQFIVSETLILPPMIQLTIVFIKNTTC